MTPGRAGPLRPGRCGQVNGGAHGPGRCPPKEQEARHG
jgi:hypothetical protein